MPAGGAPEPEPRRDPVVLCLAAATFSGSLAMMAFVALVGPVARAAGLAPWQAGLAVSASGLAWMAGARPWGLAADRRGRRPVLLAGAAAFALSYWFLCLVVDAATRWPVSAALATAGLVAGRALVGGAYAAIPAAGAALIADRVPPAGRGAAMALLGTGSGAGLVVGPGLAVLLSPLGLSAPLLVTAVLPPLMLGLLWWLVPVQPALPRPPRNRLSLSDPRLRPLLPVGFAAMFAVSVAQVSVGFYALDRLGLSPEAAAQAAGAALMAVGVALVLSQALAARLKPPPATMMAAGTALAAVGFGAVLAADRPALLVACYFVAACGMGWVLPGFGAAIANRVAKHEQGAAAGAAGFAQGLGMVLGPLAGSALYRLGPALPYALVAVLLAAAFLWTVVTARRPGAPPHAP